MSAPDPVPYSTVPELLATMARAGVARSVIVPWLPAQDVMREKVSAGADRDEAAAEVVAVAGPQRLGPGAEDELVALAERHPSLVADMSFRLGRAPRGLPADDLVRLVRRIGADRVLFGTNYPLADQIACAAAFRALPLNADERRLVGWPMPAGRSAGEP